MGVDERTLRRAVRQGTIRGEWVSPRKLRLPLGEREYIRRRWSFMSALRSVLRTEHNVRFALLFGSAATGMDSSASDIDLLVDMRDSSLDRLLALEAKLTRAVGRPVDIIRLEDAATAPDFLVDILADGRVLVDRDERQRELRERAARRAATTGLRGAERVQAALAAVDRLLGT